ncbi:hypothetical protein Poli38472_006743 [Pythium oligandrum]|uniref:EIPR1-like beta-propeller domain-containing protein n=1 Tax=Pythium oligandrum TaxID=41045 RepID=A0A8K1C5D7_PYTOL|nr:hypothetical protein Poli38472_006743 [Pythium oligandrum]|eukprot:TMW56733.1 hypothetical protein Poli38472_006743 [Pythium oligandrum]
MFGSATCSYSAGNQTRCLDALVAEKDRARFVLGTTGLQQANHLHVIEHDSSSNDASLQHLYAHPAQVLALAPSPFAKELVVTSGKAKDGATETTLWKMEGLDDVVDDVGGERPAKPLVSVASLGSASRVAWQSEASTNEALVATAQSHSVSIWTLNDAQTASVSHTFDLPISENTVVRALQWDPHHSQYLSFTQGSAIHTWDTRANSTAFTIDDAHALSVLDFDYNPNKPYTLVSGGEDGQMKFWDLRQAHKPLLSLTAHSHWLWSVRYNRFHDQLVLSSSSDATLALWRVSSISSAPIVELDEQDLMNEAAAGNDVVDTKIKSYEEHEDSVYAVAWGTSDSWIFASASYDGRVVVNQVPSTEKYKILL